MFGILFVLPPEAKQIQKSSYPNCRRLENGRDEEETAMNVRTAKIFGATYIILFVVLAAKIPGYLYDLAAWGVLLFLGIMFIPDHYQPEEYTEQNAD